MSSSTSLRLIQANGGWGHPLVAAVTTGYEKHVSEDRPDFHDITATVNLSEGSQAITLNFGTSGGDVDEILHDLHIEVDAVDALIEILVSIRHTLTSRILDLSAVNS